MVSLVQFERLGPTRVGSWNSFGGLSKLSYGPLWDASLKHITYKTVFLLAMASVGRVVNFRLWFLIPNTCSLSLRALVLHSVLALNSCVRTLDEPSPKTVKAHEVLAVNTLLHLLSKVDCRLL